MACVHMVETVGEPPLLTTRYDSKVKTQPDLSRINNSFTPP